MNEKIDKAIAEGVLGYKYIDGHWYAPDGTIWKKLPISPSSDYNHLFMALEKAREDLGVDIDIMWRRKMNPVIEIYKTLNPPLGIDEFYGCSKLKDIPLSACLALIEVYGLEVGE